MVINCTQCKITMGVFSWINKILGIDNSESNNEPSIEFQIPPINTIGKVENFTHHNNNFIGDQYKRKQSFENIFEDAFEESMSIFHLNLEEFLRKLDFEFNSLEFPSNYENNNNSPNFIQNDDFHQSSNEDSDIPKQNFKAHKYFVNSGPVKSIHSDNSSNNVSKFNFKQQASTCSYVSTNWNGRMVEQEICTKKLRDGLTEKVIVMKDGNQSCITTITENPKTGVQNFKKQLINLDESELSEFENRFSKLNLR